jgi:putative ABC transport system substrate-binding protein
MAKIIGFLGATNPDVWDRFFYAFKQTIKQLGPANGQNVFIDDQWAGGDPARYQSITQNFVNSNVDAIVTSGSEPVQVAHTTAPNMPIFFASAGSAPNAGNVIGTVNEQADSNLAKKRFNTLNKLCGNNATIAVLGNFNRSNVKTETDNIFGPHGNDGEAHNNQLNAIQVDIQGQTPAQIEAAINGLNNVALLYVCTDPTTTTNQDTIISAANKKKLKTMFAFRDYVERGGLLSQGPDLTSMFVLAAQNVHAFLGGASLHNLHAAQKHKSSLAGLNHKVVLNTMTEAAVLGAGNQIDPAVRNTAELWPPAL